MSKTFQRGVVDDVYGRLVRPPNLIQILIGPRQVGKTTAARAVAQRWSGPVHFAAADLPLPPGPEWIESSWHLARRQAKTTGKPGLLILDEVQKVRGWSEAVKAQWDQDRAAASRMRVLLLGSSSLLLSRGATESLAGRFFLQRCPHWSYSECRAAFGWDLDRWLYFGGYPGAAQLVGDEEAWRSYVVESLIETVLSRDVLAMQAISKPTLLRHLFVLATRFPAQILSYNKMLGQLQDAGNTTTLAHYLRLLQTAFLLSGLERFSQGHPRSRGSSPKLILWNNALVNALDLRTFEQTRSDASTWGRLVENAVGAHLLNHLQGLRYEISYWRDRDQEVDFVVQSGKSQWAIEVKSARPGSATGLAAFCRRYPGTQPLIVGSGGMALDDFFAHDPISLFEK